MLCTVLMSMLMLGLDIGVHGLVLKQVDCYSVNRVCGACAHSNNIMSEKVGNIHS